MTEYLADYLVYLSDWSKVRHRQHFVFPDTFEEFSEACRREDEADARAWGREVRYWRQSSHYI